MTLDLQPLNQGEEYVQPPVFEDIKEGLDYMDEQRAIEEMRIEAERLMAADTDPRKQNYFMRTDKKTVVKDEREYNLCQAKRIPLKVIPYSHAVQLLKEEEARKRTALKDKRKKKAAKKSRARNRK